MAEPASATPPTRSVRQRSSTRALKRSNLIAEAIRRQIVHGIVEGTLAPNDPLPAERELLAMFDVARPTLREAMRVLEADGLVEFRVGAGGGAFVCRPPIELAARHVATLLQLSGTTLGDVSVARRELACMAVRLAAERPSREGIAKLREIVDAAAEQAEEGLALAHRAIAFHQELMRVANNSTLMHLSLVMNDIFDAQAELAAIRTAPDSGGGDENYKRKNRAAVRAMQRVTDLIEQRNASEAESVWRQHMNAVNELLSEPVGHTQVVDALNNIGGPAFSASLWPDKSR